MRNRVIQHEDCCGRIAAATPPARRGFFGVSAAVFAASLAVTILWCTSMSDMGEMPMPGGWTMSMAWMRMPGQTWPGAAASFLGMWTVMMMAMMLPSLMPALWRYHQTMGAPSRVALGDPRLLTMLAGAGYFFVWMVLGMAVFPLGAVLTELEMQQPGLARAVPLMGGIVVLAAGAIQLTGWKARRLACCRDTSCHGSSLRAVPDSAWRHGLRLGLRCTWCCGNLMIIPLVIGVMDLSAMAAVAIAVTVERLAPASERFARAIGVVTCATGVVLIARAAW